MHVMLLDSVLNIISTILNNMVQCGGSGICPVNVGGGGEIVFGFTQTKLLIPPKMLHIRSANSERGRTVAGEEGFERRVRSFLTFD